MKIFSFDFTSPSSIFHFKQRVRKEKHRKRNPFFEKWFMKHEIGFKFIVLIKCRKQALVDRALTYAMLPSKHISLLYWFLLETRKSVRKSSENDENITQ